MALYREERMVEPISLWEYFGADPYLTVCVDMRGGVVRDLKKNDTFAPDSGTPHYRPDHFGRGVTLLSNTNLRSVNSYAIAATGSKTMLGWCRAESGGDATYAAPVCFSTTGGSGMFLNYNGGTYQSWFLSGGVWKTSSSDRKYGYGELVFLAGRSDNAGVITGSELFVNGVQQASRQTAGYNSTQTTCYTYIGTYASGTYNYNFYGWIGGAAYFDRCLTDTEIREYYERSIKDMRRYYPVNYDLGGGAGLSIPVAYHHYEQQRGMM